MPAIKASTTPIDCIPAVRQRLRDYIQKEQGH